MQEIFMNMVMATTVGNFVTFFLVILIFGVFSIYRWMKFDLYNENRVISK